MLNLVIPSFSLLGVLFIFFRSRSVRWAIFDLSGAEEEPVDTRETKGTEECSHGDEDFRPGILGIETDGEEIDVNATNEPI